MRAKPLTLAVMLALIGVLVTFSVTAPVDANSAAPDLVIESLTVSDSSPQPGESIRLVATVRNRGDAGSPTTKLRYYRSTDSSISPLDVRVDENSVSVLGPSDSTFDGTSLQAPTGAGRYYYIACVDSVTGESNTQNNCSARAPIDVASTSSARADISVTDAQVEHTCFTAIRSKEDSEKAEKGSPALLERFLLMSEVQNLTGSPLEEVFVEFEVVHPNRGESAKHESERVNITPRATRTIYPKKGFLVSFPNGTWIGKCTVKRDRPWPTRDVVLGTESVSLSFGTYPPPHIKPNIARGKLESCGPGHQSSYVVGSGISVIADPHAQLSESVRYNAHYVGNIYKDGKRVWKGEKTDNVAIILRQTIGHFTPTSPGEYILDCLMYIEHRYDYEPIQQFLTNAMPCMKSPGLASICTVLVINVDAAVGALDRWRLIWMISKTFYVTPSGQVELGAPDLEVDEPSVSHSSREVGETFTLSAAVRNSGDSGSSTSNLSYYRSSDATITTDDDEIGTSSFVDVLGAQGTSPEATIVTATGPAGDYYYGACVDSVSGETDTTNNCSSGVQVTVTAAPQTRPDLVVESPSLSDSSLGTGESFWLHASVRNTGDGISAATTLRYFRSTDSTITHSDTEVGTDDVGSQDPSDTDSEQVELTAPSNAGTYYYGACADTVSGESNTNNNCSDGVRVTVSQVSNSGPDMVVDSISVRNTKVEPGKPVRLNTTVSNVGTDSSPTFALRYYRSTDSTISSSDTLEGYDQVPQRNAGQSSRETTSLTAQSSVGAYYYGACIPDIPNESNTQNNCSDGIRVEVKHLYPDLVVESMSVSDSTPQVAQRLRLEATVRNSGDEESAGTWLRYYRSTDSTISTSDTELGARDWVGNLDPSESGEESISTRTPDDAGTYYYGACVDPVVGESDTNNNCSSGVTVTVTVTADGQDAPDLVVHSPSVYDKVFDPGERFQMSFWVRNEGDAGTTTNATLRYYRSTDSTISTADTELTVQSGVTGVGPIDASGSSLVTVYLDAHSSGTYHYGACVSTMPGESNTENNCSAVFRVTLSVADLVVESLSVSNSGAEPGASFILTVTVRNQGDSEAESTTLRYYRSTDSTISGSDTEVGTDSVSSLGPSRSSRESIDLTAPSDPGTYYYGACVDSVTGESDTNNNCSSSVSVTVTGGSLAAPDLVVQAPSVSDSSVEPGGSFTLSATVGNQGVGATASTTLRYYRSTDSTISGSDTEVGTDSVSNLDPNETSSQSISVTAPSNIGTYYYGACVDPVVGESSTGNNCSSSVAVTVATATSGSPDLRTLASVNEDLLRTGESFTLRATVSNQGNRGGGTSASTTLRYYRSTDSTISSTDTELGTEVVRALGLGQNSSLSIDLTAPASRGTYYYGACVDSVPGESNTQNDCSAGVQVTVEDTLPDLVVESPSVSDPDLETGESFTLSVTVRNQGDGTASSTTLRYYRSTDSTISSSDAFLDTDGVSSLGSGETSAESDSMTAPISAGTYYYGACVDSVSGESNTGNNCSAGVQVTVTGESQPSPDLVVQSPSVNDNSVKPGGSLTLSVTVRNQGDGSSAATTLRYYRSSNSRIITSDTEVGTDTVGILAASGTSSQSIDLTAPTDPDTYYYGACVESFSGESNTGNNCSAGVQVTVEEVFPDLVVDTPTVDESSLETGEGFRLSTTVRNQGDGRPSSTTTLRYYRSTDSTISSSDTEVGTDDVGRVRPSSTDSNHIDLTAPATAGTYYYGACVDAVQQESNTQNNCSGSVEVTVTQGNPDLVVESPSVDDSNPAAGTSFRLSGTVRNQGDRSSPATTLRYYRSTDSSISNSDTEVGTDGVRSLEPSQTSNESFDLTAPANAGTYYYGACVDSVTGESDTGNNCSSSVTVTVTGTTTTAPDLVVESPSVDDKHLDPDDNLNDDFRLTVTVRNQGDGASPEATLRYYRSTDSTITASDTQVDTDIANALTASETDEINTSIDSPTSTGTYYYGACVDSVSRESDTQNNCSTGVEVIVSKVGEGNPDLVVQSPTVSSDNLEAGTSLTVGATVRNQGTGRTPETDLRYYRSTDSTITTSDTEVDSDGIDTLGPTETTTESDGVLAPGDAGTYYFGACVESVARESNTQNNCSGGVAVTVTGSAVVGPDLVVESPSVDYSRVAPDEIFTIDVTVRNQGNVESLRTTLRYYRSTDSTITTGDTEVDTDTVSSLDPSESDGENEFLDTPETEGTYYYGACVDSVADETDTTNNCSTGVKVTVIGPDLVVESPSVDDSSLNPGQSFTLSVTVRNQGGEGERSSSTTLRYYRSTDSSISTSDTEVGTDSVSSLSADDTGAESITLDAPTTPGTYYYGACVDAESDESVTNNNCSSGVEVTVTGAPDLVVESPSASDSSLETEESFTLSATVPNDGDGSSAATTLRYYRSSDSTITTGDTEVGTDPVDGLAPSAASAESISLIAPSDAGDHHYGACVDSVTGESDTNNNCSSGVQVTVTAAPQTRPDLVVESPSLSDTSLGTGDSVTLSATVRNGDDGSSAATTLRYYRSSDSTISTSDTQVGTDSVSALSPSDTESESISVTAPSSSGTYYYGACVDSVTGESDTANNCSDGVEAIVQSIGNFDMVVASFSVRDDEVEPGGSVRLNATVQNDGTGRSRSFVVRYYHSTDSTISSSDTEVGADQVGELNSGQTGRETHSASAPSVVGIYYYGACFAAIPDELNTQNNCSGGARVEVKYLYPDLVVESPSVDDSTLGTGDRFRLEVTVRNQGDEESPSTTLRYYRSTDSTISTSDTQVDTDSVSSLDPSESDDEYERVTAPDDAGTYYYGACVDSVADESNTTNNCSTAVTVTVE